MKENKVYCDKCGKQIELPCDSFETSLKNAEPIKYYATVHFEVRAGHRVGSNQMYPIDLCNKCTQNVILDIIQGKDITLRTGGV